jgi:hypothetical protein
MGWIRNLRRRFERDLDELIGEPPLDLDQLRAAREDAERKLAATRSAGREISRVANVARALRTRNNFSARIEQAFGKDG